jgi:hypothetical protein
VGDISPQLLWWRRPCLETVILATILFSDVGRCRSFNGVRYTKYPAWWPQQRINYFTRGFVCWFGGVVWHGAVSSPCGGISFVSLRFNTFKSSWGVRSNPANSSGSATACNSLKYTTGGQGAPLGWQFNSTAVGEYMGVNHGGRGDESPRICSGGR